MTVETPLARPLVYVAGPYSGGDPVANTRKAIEVGMKLWEWGMAPLIPHLTLLAHLVSPQPVEVWYELDLLQLERCDALLRIQGESPGADNEVLYAERIGIPVFHGYGPLRKWQYFWTPEQGSGARPFKGIEGVIFNPELKFSKLAEAKEPTYQDIVREVLDG